MAGGKVVRVRVDPDKCQGHNRCKALAPALFELDEYGNAREKGENAYYQHLYMVKLDGSGLTLLDPGDASHSSQLSPTRQFLVDNSSRLDRAPETMPTPAVDRDPAQGGLGLHLVARLSVAHGWYVDDGAKHVWACLPSTIRDRQPALA